MMETDSRYSFSEMSGPHKTQPSSAPMSEFRGFVPDQLPSFLYRLRDESPLAGKSAAMNLDLHIIIFQLCSKYISAWFKRRLMAQTVASALSGWGRPKRRRITPR
jgi:hypothetical protein